MKKNRLHIFMVLSVLTGALFSCEDLDQTPNTSYPSDVVFDTPTRVDQQVNGLYDAVKDGNFLGSRALIYNDIRGEEFINRTSNGVTGLQTWNFTVVESTNEVNNTWIAAYQAINQINTFLQGMDDNAAKFVAPTFAADFATTTGINYRAEARFLRAVAYYYLVTLYAQPYTKDNGASLGLPLRLKSERSFDNNNLKRSTVAEVYAQILDDLNYAEANLPATGTTNRAHVNTAIAFKVRVYLTMGDWAKTITEANKIVTASAPFSAPTGTKFQLASTFAAVFATPWTSAESIFSFPFTTLDAPGTQNQLGYYYLPATSSTVKSTPNANAGNGDYPLSRGATGIFSDKAWAKTDARRAFTAYLVTNSGKDTVYYLTKFATASPYTDSSPIIRYAEILLDLAEAITRDTETVDSRAVELLNAVYIRSNPAAAALTVADFADADALISALLKQRRIEFLGEGLRSIDIMRLGLNFQPKPGVTATITPADKNYIWPMPSLELNTNKDLEPNPR